MTTAPRILIVDDSEDDALLIQLQLKRVLPGAVFTRVDREAAMRDALGGSDWDLIICDHSMPQFDSERAMQVLSESGADIPLVIYSGLIETGRAIGAMQAGAQDFVNKHDPARLLPVVERELKNLSMRRAKRKAESSVIQLSRYDSLTRLPNAAYLTDVVNAAIASNALEGEVPAMLCIDVDRFIRINDSFGYATGDALIRQIASRLHKMGGGGRNLARLGQDEFAIFLPANADPYQARQHAERVAREFSEPFAVSGQELFITLSIGVSLYPEHGKDAQTLLKNAESALFSAKRQGGNRIQLYEREINNGATYRLRLENALRQALRRDELFLHYQPILDLRTGRITATEALVRWRHPDFGIVGPDQFIPIAEETGLILDIGDWVLLNACLQTKRWHDYGHTGLSIAVNFSANQFQREGTAARVLRLVRESGLRPDALELEITEGVAMFDAEGAVATLRSLKDTGARIAIDDFGTGFSSLSYLKRYPIDVLKIDRSFVRDLPGDEDDATIVKTITALGHALNLVLHAEGVETPQQLSMLGNLGVQRIQGYHISRPIKAEEVVDCINRHQGDDLVPAQVITPDWNLPRVGPKSAVG